MPCRHGLRRLVASYCTVVYTRMNKPVQLRSRTKTRPRVARHGDESTHKVGKRAGVTVGSEAQVQRASIVSMIVDLPVGHLEEAQINQGTAEAPN